MKTKLRIKNFRVFDENGAIFDLNPITILTGSNSSGKSSAVKAIILLNGFLSQVKKAIDNDEPVELQNYKLDFTKYPINLLGRFDKVIHNGAQSKSITIEYTVYSLMLSKEVNVQMTFAADANDKLNNAFIESISMSTEEGVFFSSDKSAGTYCNLNIIKEDYATFLLAESSAYTYFSLFDKEVLEGLDEEEQIKNKEAVTFLHSIKKNRRNDIIRYMCSERRKSSIIKDQKDFEAIHHIKGCDSLFSIPILNKLTTLNKEDVEKYILSIILTETKERDEVVFATKKVIKAYTESEFNSFYDFFKDVEHHHLEHVKSRAGINQIERKGIHLISSRELILKQDYLFRCPYNWKEIGFLGQKKKLDKRAKEAIKRKEIEEWENQPLTFDILYEIVMEWDHHFSEKRNENCIYPDSSTFAPFDCRIDHISYLLLAKFTEAVVLECVKPEWCGNMSYVGSSRASVSRLYSLDSKDDFSQLLHKYFESKRLYLDYQKNYHGNGKRDYIADSFINQWIQKFDIGKKIELYTDDEGLGIQIRLTKEQDNTETLLADEGYGITQLVSILIQIETAILSAKGKKFNYFYALDENEKYNNKVFHYEINTISIEEPEIHLHPKYQSLLADMFVEAYEKYNIHFVIETHSEYLIRKLQLLATGHIDDVKLDRSDVSIYYVYSKGDKSSQKVKRIGICSDGYLDDTFGEGFYDEATRLSRQLM